MNYHYDDWVYREIERCMRIGMLPPGISLKLATKQEDVGGIDATYVVNHKVPLQIRARFDRPAYAADCDITFRTTEPAMMDKRTYAPLALFVWFVGNHIAAAKLIDIYRMAESIQPKLGDRPAIPNGDGTAFHSVTIPELLQASAWLRNFDGETWNTPSLGGQMRLNMMLGLYSKAG